MLGCFENFHSHWSFPGWLVGCFVGIFCSSKKLRQTKRSGGVVLLHTFAIIVAPSPRQWGWVGATFSPTRVASAGKNVVFLFVLLYLFRFFFRFTTARIVLFASSSL